ncbi:hypothetical protein OAN61_00195 [bacterium]|nr:hypothetical protein [bacterium]
MCSLPPNADVTRRVAKQSSPEPEVVTETISAHMGAMRIASSGAVEKAKGGVAKSGKGKGRPAVKDEGKPRLSLVVAGHVVRSRC